MEDNTIAFLAPTGTKMHLNSNCLTLKNSKSLSEISVAKGKKMGYEFCSKCKKKNPQEKNHRNNFKNQEHFNFKNIIREYEDEEAKCFRSTLDSEFEEKKYVEKCNPNSNKSIENQIIPDEFSHNFSMSQDEQKSISFNKSLFLVNDSEMQKGKDTFIGQANKSANNSNETVATIVEKFEDIFAPQDLRKQYTAIEISQGGKDKKYSTHQDFINTTKELYGISNCKNDGFVFVISFEEKGKACLGFSLFEIESEKELKKGNFNITKFINVMQVDINKKFSVKLDKKEKMIFIESKDEIVFIKNIRDYITDKTYIIPYINF